MNGYARLKAIFARNDGTVRISLETGNEFGCEELEYIVLGELLENTVATVGDVSDEELCMLEFFSHVTAAYFSACSSFAFAQCSLKSLYMKLISKGFSKEVSIAAIDVVRERGFVDEDDIAIRRAEIMMSKLWGKKRILAKLREEGFLDSSIEKASSLISKDDLEENCVRLIEKKYGEIPSDRHQREKMYAALLRMGFSQSEIRAAINKMTECD